MDYVEQLLKDLTEAHGVPGFENEIRSVIRPLLENVGAVSTDNLGSLVCEMEGDGPRVLMMAHMDEIGFMVRHITKEGFIKFIQLGGWWDQVLLGHRVILKTRNGDILGVIGAKPPHLVEPDERNKVVEKKNMYIDIGVSSAAEVEEAGVRIGDYIVPDSSFEVMVNGKTYVSKAFDDRVGCGVMIEAMNNLKQSGSPNKIFGVASVQEEVGTRGAKTSVSRVKPDVAIVLESGIAGDVPGISDEVSSEKLGGGPVIGIYDGGMIAHNQMRDFFFDQAAEMEIPVQISFIERGGTDGRQIQLFEDGVPTIVISVSARHIHSHNSIIHRDDFDQTVQLVTAAVQKLDSAVVNALRSFE